MRKGILMLCAALCLTGCGAAASSASAAVPAANPKEAVTFGVGSSISETVSDAPASLSGLLPEAVTSERTDAADVDPQTHSDSNSEPLPHQFETAEPSEQTASSEAPVEVPPEQLEPVTLYCAADEVNVRAAPSVESEIMGTLHRNDSVFVIGTEADWTAIRMGQNTYYVFSDYLSATPTQRLEETTPPADMAGGKESVSMDPGWEFADSSVIYSGSAVLYRASENRKDIVIGLNAGHGTSGGAEVYTYCHPDRTPKVTGGTTAAGSLQAAAVSTGMTFLDGTPERDVTLREAQILRDLLLENGYDVLMIRDGEDVQLDNVARTVICNNAADCHIALHWDGDGLSYDKGCFYIAVADGIKDMYPVSTIWQAHDRLGSCLISGLAASGAEIFGDGFTQLDLTQTSYSTIPSVDIELGNAASDHSDDTLSELAGGLLAGIDLFFGG